MSQHVDSTMSDLKKKNRKAALEKLAADKKAKKNPKTPEVVSSDEDDDAPQRPTIAGMLKIRRITPTLIPPRPSTPSPEKNKPCYEEEEEEEEETECTCNSKLLADAYESGLPFCYCGTVNMVMLRTGTRGVELFEDALRQITSEYCEKDYDCIDPPDIIYYHPADTAEPTASDMEADDAAVAVEEARQKKQAAKKKRCAKVMALMDDSASVEDEHEVEDVQAPQPKKKKTNPPKLDEPEKVKKTKAEEKVSDSLCPMCNTQMGISTKPGPSNGKTFCIGCSLPYSTVQNQHIVNAAVRVQVRAQYKPASKGLPPICDLHQFPCGLRLCNFEEKDKQGKPIELSTEKKVLKGRIFFVCNAPEELTKTMPGKRKCDFVRSAEYKPQGARALHMEELYLKEIIETRAAREEGYRNYAYKEKQELQRRQAMRLVDEANLMALGVPSESDDEE